MIISFFRVFSLQGVNYMKRAIWILTAVLGAFAFIDGIAGAVMTNFNIGFLAEIFAGLFCIAICVFWNKIKSWKKAVSLTAVAAVLCCALAICIYGTHDTADYNEDVLIVLGAAVHGETPSYVLVKRLDAAVEYLNENTDAKVIVTGGQGAQEHITEAEAMERYLARHGIDENRIFKEEKATSTLENYIYSKEIIDVSFPSAKIATVTNDFHIFRAKRLAKAAGLETSTLHAKTPLSGIAAMYLREMLAIAKLLVFGP